MGAFLCCRRAAAAQEEEDRLVEEQADTEESDGETSQEETVPVPPFPQAVWVAPRTGSRYHLSPACGHLKQASKVRKLKLCKSCRKKFS